jgi:hypothetical protein
MASPVDQKIVAQSFFMLTIVQPCLPASSIDIAAEAQHPIRSGCEGTQDIFAGVKAEVPNRPGGHLLIISVSASWRARRPA